VKTEKIDGEMYDLIPLTLRRKSNQVGIMICVIPNSLPGAWNLHTAGLSVDHQVHEIKTQLSTLLMAIKNFEYLAGNQNLSAELSQELNDFLITSLKAVNKITKLSEGLMTVFADHNIRKEEVYIEDLLHRLNVIEHDDNRQITVLQSDHSQSKLLVNKRALFTGIELLMAFLSRNTDGIILNTKQEQGITVFEIRVKDYNGPALDYLFGGSELSHNDLLPIRQLFLINNIECKQQGCAENEKVLTLHFNQTRNEDA